MRASSTSSSPSQPAVAQVPSQEAYTKVEPYLLNRNDFVWTNKEEPHLRRKYEMLKKYPQIEKLFGYDPETKWQCIFFVFLHFLICYLVKDRSWWLLIPTAWLVGGAFVQSLTVAIHEITHGMCFEKLEHNYYFAIFCNLGMGIPSAMTFKRYHSEHHLYLGVPGFDADITTKYEGKYVRGPFMKILHIIFLGLIYGIKPLLVSPKVPNKWEILNITVSLTFDAVLVMLWGYRALVYCLIATLFGLGLHPLSGHFISEHWLTKTGQETYSYYGPANWFMFNVGYHNEHHDFPRIPCTKLPLLKVIAPEYYGFEDVIGMKREGDKQADDKYSSEVQPMYHLDSWTGVLWNYITTDGYTPFVRKVRTIEDHKKARKDWYSRGYTEHACSNEENQS